MVRKTEAVTPPDMVAKLLDAAGSDLVLVGGQALAFWADRFGLRVPRAGPAVTNDVDFLTPSAADKEVVERFANVLEGQALFPNIHALTALVGQAYRFVSDEQYVNVDVIFSVVGLDGDAVRNRAVTVEPGLVSRPFKVMHPLDVLLSRLVNLYKLQDKQNQKGCLQLGLAIDVAREFLRQQATSEPAREIAAGRSPIQAYVTTIEHMALQDAGRKVAKRFGLHVADAIDPLLIPAGPFWSKRWPTLKTLMSQAYAGRFEATAVERQSAKPKVANRRR